MYNPKMAVEIAKKKYPDRTVTAIIDYKSDLYLLELARSLPASKENTSIFTLDKISGKMTPFAIGSDFIGFSKAAATKQIPKNEWA